jgi:hypothetical protein
MFQENIKSEMIDIKRVSGTDFDSEDLEYRNLW